MAEELKGFSLKTVSRNITPAGMPVLTTTTTSTNIEKKDPEDSPFDIPKGYKKCKNIVELMTGGKLGKRLKKRDGRRGLIKK